MNNHVLITSVGWEPRFLEGVKDILAKEPVISNAIVFHPRAFNIRTSDVLIKLESLFSDKNISSSVVDIDCNAHVDSWRSVESGLASVKPGNNVILDITTMPRHLIWACLHFLELAKVRVQCIYYPPESYGNWLSSDNGRPKLVFRHSGIAYPDRATCLLLFSGFDSERATQIVDAFEPAKIILVTHNGHRFENATRCVKNLVGRSEIVEASLDAYADISALQSELIRLVADEVDQYNVVATTVGPRCSAIALYALNRAIPAIGLLYANSHLYNENYSVGIDLGSRFNSTIDFQQQIS